MTADDPRLSAFLALAQERPGNPYYAAGAFTLARQLGDTAAMGLALSLGAARWKSEPCVYAQSGAGCEWHVSSRADPRAAALADRHYTRQKIGSAQFVPPGRCLVLLTAQADALWVTSWPFAEYVKHAWAGAWICSLFRNEGSELSSDLIREAVSVTRWYYGEPPALGFVTFVDPGKVRRKRDPGRCYRKAEWKHVGYTAGGLVALQQLPDAMPPPMIPNGAQLRLFEEAA